MIVSTYNMDSQSTMQDLIVGNILAAEIEEQGNKQAMQDHFLFFMETGYHYSKNCFKQVPNSFPVLYEMSGFHEFRPFEQ